MSSTTTEPTPEEIFKYSTFEWECQGCHERTWHASAGGNLNCSCPADAEKPDPPVRAWSMLSGKRTEITDSIFP